MTPDEAVRLEGALFAIGRPVTPAELASALDLPRKTVTQHLRMLSNSLRERGIRLVEHNDEWQLVAAPEAARTIERLAGVPSPPRLSSAALETLAVIAYRQPVTRAQIEAIRGVDCTGVLGGLLDRGLIEEAGRSEAVGRPILYSTTMEFLRHFGLYSLDDLPPFPDTDRDN